MENTNQSLHYTVVTADEFAKAKAEGRYPLAPITFLRSEKENGNGRKRIYYAEIVSNTEAGWVTKGDPQENISQFDLEDLKHAVWAAVEVFHQHRLTIMEHGTHILDVDMSKTPEMVIGAVAAWSTHPNFVKFAPADGWVAIKARNVGAGNIHYVLGDTLADGQETKYDYEDMLVSQSANFRLFIPPFLDTPRALEDGGISGTWVDAVLSSLSLSRDESVAQARAKSVVWNVNDRAYNSASVQVAKGREVLDTALVVMGVNDEVIDLSQISEARYHVYGKFGGTLTMLRTIKWDQSPFAKALVAQYRQYRFSDKAL